MPDPYLDLSDKIEVVIDEAQAHHINGSLSMARSKLYEAQRLIGELMALESCSGASRETNAPKET